MRKKIKKAASIVPFINTLFLIPMLCPMPHKVWIYAVYIIVAITTFTILIMEATILLIEQEEKKEGVV